MTPTRYRQRTIPVRGRQRLVLFLLCFAVGAIAGAAFAKNGVELNWRLVEAGGNAPRAGIRLLSAVLRAARFLIVLYCCGFLRWGSGLILLTLAGRGFLMSFTVGALLRGYGTAGYALAFGLLLIHGFALLPLTFRVAAYSAGRCGDRRLRHQPNRLTGEDRLVAVVIFLAAVACAAADCLLTPPLLEWLQALLDVSFA